MEKTVIPTTAATLKSGGIPFSGDLTVHECASITNWFVMNIPNSGNRRHAWIGRVPLAHAYTEVIAVRKHDEIKGHPSFPHGKSSAQQSSFILQQAWSLQCNTASQEYRHADIDKECLLLLEEAMFEMSMRAGQAGHFQWGLDAGPHQNDWSPYHNRPAHWNHDDRDGSESELIVRTVVLFSGVGGG
jgi:hypothetical protein